MQTAADNVPRFDHNPITGESLGLLIEESRVNLLLNSETLSTQNITTTAAARTLSFYGTGSVTLSGTHVAVVTGTGANVRTSLTYTPTAGTLTLTVAGSVKYANDELGAFATSWIPTTGASATRAADVASMTGTNFSDWYNQTEGGFVFSGRLASASAALTSGFLSANDGTTNNRHQMYWTGGGAIVRVVASGAASNNSIFNDALVAGVPFNIAYAYGAASNSASCNGGTVSTATQASPSNCSVLEIGNANAFTAPMNGHIARISYYAGRPSNSIVRGLSS
jgi:hypothetical protein